MYKAFLSVAPIRAAASDTAEIVTQLLYGERVELIQKGESDWVKVRCEYDNYEGWMDRKQLVESTSRGLMYVFDQHLGLIVAENKWISAGSLLSSETLAIVSDPIDYSDADSIDRIVDLSLGFLDVPYLWGGRSIFGIDCSGLTQVVFKCAGIKLPRDAKDQALAGQEVPSRAENQVGDLAFFTKKVSEKITHVGIILEDSDIIHASGRVRIDKLDDVGIFNEETANYTHYLKTIKRFI